MWYGGIPVPKLCIGFDMSNFCLPKSIQRCQIYIWASCFLLKQPALVQHLHGLIVLNPLTLEWLLRIGTSNNSRRIHVKVLPTIKLNKVIVKQILICRAAANIFKKLYNKHLKWKLSIEHRKFHLKESMKN